MKQLFFFIGLLLLSSCQQQKKAEETTTPEAPKIPSFTLEKALPECIEDAYIVCDTHPPKAKPPKKKKVKKKPPKKKLVKRKRDNAQSELLKQHATLFLEALKQKDIRKASQYATDGGLSTFLKYDIDGIQQFKIGEYEADEYIGTASVKMNQLAPIVFYFTRKGGKGNYRFVGPKNW